MPVTIRGVSIHQKWINYNVKGAKSDSNFDSKVFKNQYFS